MKMLLSTALISGILVAGAAPALAASDADLAAFGNDVKAACLKAGEPLFNKASAAVDPNGSASYGLALLRGKAKGTKIYMTVICVYNRASKAVEVGTDVTRHKKKPAAK